jgi:hypothetical protein
MINRAAVATHVRVAAILVNEAVVPVDVAAMEAGVDA